MVVLSVGWHENVNIREMMSLCARWGNLTYSEECLHLKNGHVPPGCDVLFFDKTAVSSLESLNLLA